MLLAEIRELGGWNARGRARLVISTVAIAKKSNAPMPWPRASVTSGRTHSRRRCPRTGPRLLLYPAQSRRRTDDAAERLYEAAGLSVGNLNAGLIDYMSRRYGVRIARVMPATNLPGIQRRYDTAARVLHLSPHLRPGQHAFQMATQLAFLEVDGSLRQLVDEARC